jgi:hypothetical protein
MRVERAVNVGTRSMKALSLLGVVDAERVANFGSR